MTGENGSAAQRGRIVLTVFGSFLIYCAALAAGLITTGLMFVGYIALRMASGLPPVLKQALGYNVIDDGTPWQWTFNLLLWGLPALPLCRWLLGFIAGHRPPWGRMFAGFGALGVLLYFCGVLAYETDLDRRLLVACGVVVLLTFGFAATRRWITVA